MIKPVRVLHICHTMGLGGIETWLMNILRNIDRDRYQFDFLVYTDQAQFYDEEIRCLGSKIIPCIHPSRGIQHLLDLKRILSIAGPYDAIHAHGSQTIGNTLRTAAQAGIKTRIAHSHNATSCRGRRLRSLMFEPIARYWLNKYMTVGLGASEAACNQLFGYGWKSDPRCKVLLYGIDWHRFNKRIDRKVTRHQLGLPADSLVVGHVGRFVPEKNHQFLIKVARQIVEARKDVFFLLVGDGRLKSSIEGEVRQSGMERNIIFPGVQSDIPALLQAMDVFCLPSLSEGLGIAFLEAQAVGLPCVVSSCVPDEATVIKKQVTRLSLSLPVDDWVNAILASSMQDRAQNHPLAWEAVSKSRFSLSNNITKLTHIYQGHMI